MKTIAIIPARGGSKRLPGKNTKLLGEIPLLAHSILYAKQHNFIDAVYVSTDDVVIKEIALQYGAIVIDRPQALSGDLEPTVSALKHVLESIDGVVENVILLQATNPLRPDNFLQDAFVLFQEKQVRVNIILLFNTCSVFILSSLVLLSSFLTHFNVCVSLPRIHKYDISIIIHSPLNLS